MGIDEKLQGMDVEQLGKYKSKEKVKAIVGTVVSVIPVTAALGAAIGGFVGYELLSYVNTEGMSPESGYAMGMFTVAAPAVIGGATSWISGAIYTGKKWYNTHKSSKRLNDIIE